MNTETNADLPKYYVIDTGMTGWRIVPEDQLTEEDAQRIVASFTTGHAPNI